MPKLQGWPVQSLTLTFTDKVHVSCEYPKDWKVWGCKNEPGSRTVQPIDKFTKESKANSIFISVVSHCVDAECTATYSLDDIVKQLGVKVLGKANAKNTTGYKVSFPGLSGKEQTGYIFIKGKDMVTVPSDIYPDQLDPLLPTTTLLGH